MNVLVFLWLVARLRRLCGYVPLVGLILLILLVFCMNLLVFLGWGGSPSPSLCSWALWGLIWGPFLVDFFQKSALVSAIWGPFP